jgi:sugar/nucleoside kinase (ribokinase family)
MSLVVVGSVAIDNIISPEGRKDNSMGGSACYFSCAASYFVPVNFVGIIGRDYPEEYLDLLRSKNISLEGLEVVDGESFRWTGEYSADFTSVETHNLALNVFEQFDPILPDSYRQSEFVFLANIDPILQMKVMNQVKNPRLVVMDTMDFWIKTRRKELLEMIKRVDILILNDGEARMLSEEHSLIKAAKILLQWGPKKVIVKRGEHGAFLIDNEGELFSIPAYPVEKVIDTTGAGDSFAGGFMGHITKAGTLNKETFRVAMVYGISLSSFTVEGFSLDRLSKITLQDREERFGRLKEMTTF